MSMIEKGTLLRVCLALIFAAGFLIFLAPVFTGIINIGNTAGMALFAALFLLTIFWSRFYDLLIANGIVRGIFAVIAAGAGFFLILAVIISVKMISAANDPPQGNTTVIVLGCKVRGETPSLMLNRRINAAYGFLSENPDSVCIASGGQGSDELISEAECIKRVLVEKGISPDRIIEENRSASTDENIRFSMEKMKEQGITGSVTIVSSDFHQLRASMIGSKYGLEVCSVSAETPMWLLPTYWLREILGVIYQFVFK